MANVTRCLSTAPKKASAVAVQTLEKISSLPAKSTVFSMIQPTGKIHLGNYLGAVRNWRDISDESRGNSTVIFGIADLHAITIPKEPIQLTRWRYEAIASLVASGIDPEKCILYHQSSVLEHTYLNWILTCLTSMGALNRMTQWKLKTKVGNSSSIYDDDILNTTNSGILNYPVLQAADILLYKSTHVPVGDDQTQHLELCRDIAQKFNRTYKREFFPLPKTLMTPTKKILSLRNPEKKMSKSDPDQSSCIYVTDEPKVIQKKVRRAITDSIQGPPTYDPITRPGVSNLVNIVSGLKRMPVDDTVGDMSSLKDHKQLKDYVSDLIIEEFKDQRHMYNQLMEDRGYLESINKLGSQKARAIALPNLEEIKDLVGFG